MVVNNQFIKIKYSICVYLKHNLFYYASLGLFERHKLLFAFNMTIKIEQAEGRVPQEELEFFIKGEMSTDT